MYHELTVWSRGIIMDKEARDVSSCIAAAARAQGLYADNVSDYVDDPDRTNCLVRRYARFGDSPIVDRFVYENPRPDWVVLVEETIIKAVNFLRGTPDGQGVLVVNSARDPDYLLKFLPDSMRAKLAKLVVVDAVGLADQRGSSPWMFVRDLGELAYDRMSTEGAEERLAIGMGIAAPLIGALVAATGELPVDVVAEQVADRDAMFRGVEKHQVIEFSPVQATTPLTAELTGNRTRARARRLHVRTRHPDPAAPATADRRRDAAAHREGRASGCSRPATSASSGRSTRTRCRRATTPARPASRSRSTWTTSSTSATSTAT